MAILDTQCSDLEHLSDHYFLLTLWETSELIEHDQALWPQNDLDRDGKD